jgi:ketosteroid isomerase-like protein
MNLRFSNPQSFAFISLFCICSIFPGCNNNKMDADKEQKEINTLLDAWNRAAAKADYNTYFNAFSEDAVFIGTDATEYWNKKDFMVWAKPFFDKGKAWNFTSLERHIYFDATGKTAWFDELLHTQMKICRGSGVMVKKDKEWKIQQYVLSMTIPNEKSDTITILKTPIEDSIINKLQGRKKM